MLKIELLQKVVDSIEEDIKAATENKEINLIEAINKVFKQEDYDINNFDDEWQDVITQLIFNSLLPFERKYNCAIVRGKKLGGVLCFVKIYPNL